MSSGEQSVKQFRGPYPFRQEWKESTTVESIEVLNSDGSVRGTYVIPVNDSPAVPFKAPVPDVEYVEHESGVTFVVHKDK